MKCRRNIKEKDNHYNLSWFGFNGIKDIEGNLHNALLDELPKNVILIKKKSITENEGTENAKIKIIKDTVIIFPIKNDFEKEKFENFVDDLKEKIAENEKRRIEYKIDSDNEKFILINGVKHILAYEISKDDKNNDVYTFKRYKIINENEYIDIDNSKTYTKYQEGVKDSLIQRLSVIKGELWYNINYGLPLFEKIRNKGIMDAVIINIVLSHPDVRGIKTFTSKINRTNNHYEIENMAIITKYADEIIITNLFN